MEKEEEKTSAGPNKEREALSLVKDRSSMEPCPYGGKHSLFQLQRFQYTLNRLTRVV